MGMNFEELKAAVPIEKAINMLGLKGKWTGQQWRGICPACKGNSQRSLALDAQRGLFTCFSTKPWTRGSIIKLVCHVRGLDPKAQALEAAEAIAQHFGIPIGAATAPQRPEPGTNPAASPANGKPGIESVAATLIPEHELVQALELSPEQAAALGIGFRKTGGSLSGRVLIPVRTQSGEPVCYVGWHPEKDPPLKFGKINLP